MGQPAPVLTVINRNSKWVVALAFLQGISLLPSLQQSPPHVHAAWCACGVILLSYAAKLLKFLVRQPRPAGSGKRDSGMPSNHATGIMYCSGYYMAVACHPSDPWSLGLGMATVVVGLALSWLRVVHRQHNVVQVMAGVLLGGLGAPAWHGLGVVWADHWLAHHAAVRRLLYGFCILCFLNFFMRIVVKAMKKREA